MDEISGTGGVSYQLATQAGGGVASRYNYAVGSSDGGLPGHLLRQTDSACVLSIPDPSQDTYISYWQSQRVVEEGGTDSGNGTNPPCYQELIAEAAVTEDTFLRCQGTYQTSSNCCRTAGQIVNNNACGLPTCVDIATQCECPPGFSKLGNSSGWCCPDGSTFSNGQCQQVAITHLPASGDFLEAIGVGSPNVLDGLDAPFKVNLPINPDDFQANPAVGVE